MYFVALMFLSVGIDDRKPCISSWYGASWNGRLTASGTIYNCDEMVCAHCALPLGSIILMINPENNVMCIVRITDTGPWAVDENGDVIYPLRPHPTRQFDLSRAAFDTLTQGNLDQGLVELEYCVIGRNTNALRYNL